MAEEADSGEKTEAPSGRRKSNARKQGQVGQSKDLSQVFGIIAAFVALQNIAPDLWSDLQFVTQSSFTTHYSKEPMTIIAIQNEMIKLLRLLLPEILLIVFFAALFGAGCTAFQTNFLWSWKLVRPRFKMLNPISGLKRLFSAQNFVTTAKAIIKLCIICPIGYFAFFEFFQRLLGLMDVPITDLLPFTSMAASEIFWKIIAWLFILAILDIIWQKWQNYKKLKMSKWEVKEEQKATEGDEKMRRRIIAIGLQRARDRMMKAVPTADVVVTNPTHLSIALKYTMEPGCAPKVVAKGRGYVALRIRDIAREHGVPVIERKPLAQALFKSVEVGQEIPYQFYKAVAELLAYVYKLKHKNPFAANMRAAQETT